MDFIHNLLNNSTFYYILVAVCYAVVIAFIIVLLVNRQKKRSVKTNTPVRDLDDIDIEAVLDKMQEDVSTPKDDVVTFEQEQEDKAIISYQELVKAVKEHESNGVVKVEVPDEVSEEAKAAIDSILNEPDEKEEISPIVLDSEDDKEVVVQPIKDDINSQDIHNKEKFQNSEFISPIFGRVNNRIDYPKVEAFNKEPIDDDLGKTIVMKPIVEEINNNDEFLKVLKEFRNNLE